MSTQLLIRQNKGLLLKIKLETRSSVTQISMRQNGGLPLMIKLETESTSTKIQMTRKGDLFYKIKFETESISTQILMRNREWSLLKSKVREWQQVYTDITGKEWGSFFKNKAGDWIQVYPDIKEKGGGAFYKIKWETKSKSTRRNSSWPIIKPIHPLRLLHDNSFSAVPAVLLHRNFSYSKDIQLASRPELAPFCSPKHLSGPGISLINFIYLIFIYSHKFRQITESATQEISRARRSLPFSPVALSKDEKERHWKKYL